MLKPLSGYHRSLEPLVIKKPKDKLDDMYMYDLKCNLFVWYIIPGFWHIVLEEEISLSSASLASCMVLLSQRSSRAYYIIIEFASFRLCGHIVIKFICCQLLIFLLSDLLFNSFFFCCKSYMCLNLFKAEIMRNWDFKIVVRFWVKFKNFVKFKVVLQHWKIIHY